MEPVYGTVIHSFARLTWRLQGCGSRPSGSSTLLGSELHAGPSWSTGSATLSDEVYPPQGVTGESIRVVGS